MTIEESDYRLTPSLNNASNFWDLELMVTIKPKNGEPRNEFKLVAYGLTLTSAIRHIINYRIIHKIKDGAIAMKEYLKLYQEEMKKIDIYERCDKD